MSPCSNSPHACGRARWRLRVGLAVLLSAFTWQGLYGQPVLLHLSTFYAITNTAPFNYWLIVAQFAPLANGYVLYDATDANSINVANSLCRPFNAVAVDASIENTTRLLGLSNKIADVRARDEQWAWTNYPTLFSRSNVVELAEWFTSNSLCFRVQLR